MPKYSYKVQDIEDREMIGTIDGGSEDEVLDVLAERNLIPISISELNFDGSKKGATFSEKFSEGLHKSKNKVPYKSVVFFTRQLATMVKEGVPLAKALEQLSKDERPVFKKIIEAVAFDISTGYTFSDAVSKHPSAFNNMFVSVCRAGEVSGSLDKVLEELADYMENVEAMKQKVKGAMRYPTVIACLVSAMLVLILVWLVPIFKSIYESVNADLPVPTLILLACSDAIKNHFIIVTLAVIALVLLFKYLMTRDDFKFQLHKYILKAPVFGLILRKNILANYCRTMALLMESGTPILKATEMASMVVNNKLYSEKLEEVYDNLKQGDMLSAALEKSGEFPVLVTQLVTTGEASGKVDALLRKAAEFYEREIKIVVDSLASIIEPILIIILGVIVGGILVALYLPVMMMGQFIK